MHAVLIDDMYLINVLAKETFTSRCHTFVYLFVCFSLGGGGGGEC